jgi:hypothetical protein
LDLTQHGAEFGEVGLGLTSIPGGGFIGDALGERADAGHGAELGLGEGLLALGGEMGLGGGVEPGEEVL